MVVVLNNEAKPATIEFEVAPAGLLDGVALIDRLGGVSNVNVKAGKLKVSLPARSASVFAAK